MRPQLRVVTTPDKIVQGQMMAVQAYIFDPATGLPVIFNRIYMQIIDKKGIEVWPLSTIAENTDRMNKLISTAQLKDGTYQLRVSTSKKLSPMAYSFFEVEKKPIGLGFLPLIPAILLGLKTDKKSKKVGSPILEPEPEPTLITIVRMFYQTEIDGRVCPICIGHREVSFAKGGWDPHDPFIPVIGPEELGGDTHFNCVIGSTEIKNPEGLLNIMRSWYDGPVLKINISSGRSITVTPNHMFLTPNGFAAANLLREGDDIIYSPNIKRTCSFIRPNIDRKPSTIEEIFISLNKSSGMCSKLMPSTTEDLHGDSKLTNGYINIISSKSLLRNTLKTFFFEHFEKLPFIRRIYNSFILNGDSHLTSFFKSALSSSNRIMSGTRKSDSFFSSRLRHSEIHGLTSSSRSNTIQIQSSSNRSSTDLQLIRNSLDRHSDTVELQNIISINIKPFIGHVYDLQTPSTLYSGNGIILSNCRCHYDITTDFAYRAQLMEELQEVHDVYQAVQVAKQYWSES